jgi:hypothetical protein
VRLSFWAVPKVQRLSWLLTSSPLSISKRLNSLPFGWLLWGVIHHPFIVSSHKRNTKWDYNFRYADTPDHA